jgi:hypothetical protein
MQLELFQPSLPCVALLLALVGSVPRSRLIVDAL